MAHSYFDELRDQNCKLPNNQEMPPLFNFSKLELERMTDEERRILVPDWYRAIAEQQEAHYKALSGEAEL